MILLKKYEVKCHVKVIAPPFLKIHLYLKYKMATTTNNGVSIIYKIVAADGSIAEVHSQGAHLTSWKGPTGDERLYTSPTAVFKEGSAIRGGVPIIFPVFGDKDRRIHISSGFNRGGSKGGSNHQGG
jgi:D-hexose-6-phosphate mutarotase